MRRKHGLKEKVVRQYAGKFRLSYVRALRKLRQLSSMKRVMTALMQIRAVLTGFGVAIIIIPSTFALVGRLLLLLCFLAYRWLNNANPFRITGILIKFICSRRLSRVSASTWLAIELENVFIDLEDLARLLIDLLRQWEKAGLSRWQMNLRLVGYALGASWAIFRVFFTRLLGSRQSLR